MKINFVYDSEKDLENFLKSASAVNNKNPTRLQRLYREKHVQDPTPEYARAFIEEYLFESRVDISEKLERIETAWRKVEKRIITRMERMFGIDYPEHEITVYLSTNSRCRFNILKNYFFVHSESPHTNGIIAHELLHFFTFYAYKEGLEAKGITTQAYKDIAESLTELLNIEFADLVGMYVDHGYPQHAHLRKVVRDEWECHKDLRRVVHRLTELCEQ